MDAYQFCDEWMMRDFLNVVRSAENDGDLTEIYSQICQGLARKKMGVGDTFNVLYTARNAFVERIPMLWDWIDALMPNIITAITPNDEDFRRELLRSWADAISG